MMTELYLSKMTLLRQSQTDSESESVWLSAS